MSQKSLVLRPLVFSRSATSFISMFVAGKTTLVLRMLEHEKELFSSLSDHYFWCLPNGSEPPKAISDRSDFQIHYGVPDGATLPCNSMVILDDLQTEQGLQTQLLYTVHSHHRNLTVISLNHNLFPKNRFARDLSQSTKYIIACNNPRDAQAFYRLALQLEPNRARSLYQAYLDACSRPFGYLLCDLTQEAHPALRYRSQLFPSDGGLCTYCSDEDIQQLVREDNQYERFCPGKHSPAPSAFEIQPCSPESSAQVADSAGSGLPM